MQCQPSFCFIMLIYKIQKVWKHHFSLKVLKKISFNFHKILLLLTNAT